MPDSIGAAGGQATYSAAVSYQEIILNGKLQVYAVLLPGGDDPLAWAEFKQLAPASGAIKLELLLAPPANAPLYCMVGIAVFNGDGAPYWDWQPALSKLAGSASFTQPYPLDRSKHLNGAKEVVYCILAMALPRSARLPGERYHDTAGVGIISNNVVTV